MKNLILLMGFGLVMFFVMVKAVFEYRHRQQQSRLQATPKLPRQNIGYLSQPIAHS